MMQTLRATNFTKWATGFITVMLVLSCVFLLAACGPKEKGPMDLKGQTMQLNAAKTEFTWKAETTEEQKTEIKESMGDISLSLVFNADGSTSGNYDMLYQGTDFWYTQNGKTLKIYTNAEKTVEAVPVPESESAGLVLAVGENSLSIQFVMPEDTDQGFTAYTMHLFPVVA